MNINLNDLFYELNLSDKIKVWNQYCADCGKADSIIYVNCLDELLRGNSPSEVAQYISHDNYKVYDEYAIIKNNLIISCDEDDIECNVMIYDEDQFRSWLENNYKRFPKLYNIVKMKLNAKFISVGDKNVYLVKDKETKDWCLNVFIGTNINKICDPCLKLNKDQANALVRLINQFT